MANNVNDNVACLMSIATVSRAPRGGGPSIPVVRKRLFGAKWDTHGGTCCDSTALSLKVKVSGLISPIPPRLRGSGAIPKGLGVGANLNSVGLLGNNYLGRGMGWRVGKGYAA